MPKHVLSLDCFQALVQPINPTNNPLGKFSWTCHGDKITVKVMRDVKLSTPASNPQVFVLRNNVWKNANGDTEYQGRRVLFASKDHDEGVQELWLENGSDTDCDVTIPLKLSFTPKKVQHGVKLEKSIKLKNGCRSIFISLYIDSKKQKLGGSKEFRGDGIIIASETSFGKAVKGVKDFKTILK